MSNENKKVIMHNKDGVKISPVIHANSIMVNGDGRPLGEILDDNKESIENVEKMVDSNITEINRLSDLHDDLLYYDDDGEIDKITDLAIIIEPELVTADVNNADLILREIRKIIRKMDEKSVMHTKSDDPEDRIRLNSTQQEIENIRTEMALLRHDMRKINNVLDDFLTTDYSQGIIDNIREIELKPVNDKLLELEGRIYYLENEIRRINEIIGVDNVTKLPDGQSINTLLWALYSTAHNFIDLENDTNQTKNEE